MPPADDKFQNLDLPKILAALHAAREANAFSVVTVHFDSTGGVLGINVEIKKKFK